MYYALLMLRNGTFQTLRYSCQTSAHYNLGTQKGFSVEAVNLVLAGCPVETRICFTQKNPKNKANPEWEGQSSKANPSL